MGEDHQLVNANQHHLAFDSQEAQLGVVMSSGFVKMSDRTTVLDLWQVDLTVTLIEATSNPKLGFRRLTSHK